MLLFGGGIAILTSGSIIPGNINNSDNWGLGFDKEGEKPRGNATVDELKRYNAYFIDETDDKIIYLTLMRVLKMDIHLKFWMH